MKKRPVTPAEAGARIADGARVMIGGFMGVGTPECLMDELARQGKRDLTVIANDSATPGHGIGKLIDAGVVGKPWRTGAGLAGRRDRRGADEK